MKRDYFKEYEKDKEAGTVRIPKYERKELKKGSKVKLKGKFLVSTVSSYGTFGSKDLTGAVLYEEHKFPISEFLVEDVLKEGVYVTNDNIYEVLGFSKTGNAVLLEMANKKVLVFKRCLEVVE